LIKTLEDVKGKKILSFASMHVPWAEALEAIPISITMTGPGDMYTALDSGMANTCFFPQAPSRAYKIFEVCPYTTLCNIGLTPWFLIINREVYDDLPADLRQIIDEECGAKWAEWCGWGLDEGARGDGQYMKEYGSTYYPLPSEEVARWSAVLAPIEVDFIADMDAEGVDVRPFLTELKRYVDELVEQGAFIPDYEHLYGDTEYVPIPSPY